MTDPSIALIASHFLQARWRWHSLRAQDLERYQDRRAQRIVAYTLRHSPFYRSHWAGHDPQAWQTLPMVDKQMMMENFDTFTTCGITRDAAMETALRAEQSRDFRPLLNGLAVGLSSGTSGHRGLFLANTWEQAAWTGTILARTLHHLSLQRLRVAFFLRSNSKLYEQVGRGHIQFRYFDLMLPLAEAVTALNDFQPHILISPPSLLGFLADEYMHGSLHIRPDRLISVAEVLEDQDQDRLQRTFSAPVHQIYQCTEGFLATSCVKGSLHIQEDVVALQFEPLPDGERVMPIVTDLWRRTQPIIRYRLNDILQLDPAPCACGSPFRVIRSIEGRSDDVCYFETLSGDIRPFFPDTIRRMLLLASPQIIDYQVIQERCGQLRIHLAVSTTASFDSVVQSVCASVAATMAQYSCRPASIQVEKGLPPLIPGMKRRRVQRVKD
ncbi:MAG TPA: F390 synthetase-related protein [Ktedonosporobacter sp.]|nr:F390 synthetase-related protein [Ktedonosporobacter sp.]